MMRIQIAMLLLLITSCSRDSEQATKITKIELARSGSWSDEGAAINIQKSLTVMYYGKLSASNNKTPLQLYTGKFLCWYGSNSPHL